MRRAPTLRQFPNPLRLIAALVLSSVWLAGTCDAADWPQWRGPDRNGVSNESGWTTDWPSDGPTPLWRAQVGAGYSSLVVADGRAYTMGSDDGSDTVWCLDAATGEVIWKQSYACASGLFPGTRCTPTVHGGYVYTLSREGHIHCFRADSGELVWTTKVSAEQPIYGFASSPLIHDDLLIVNTGSYGMAFDKTTGSPLWGEVVGKAGYASVVSYRGNYRTSVLVLSSRALFSVDPTSGRKFWEFEWDTRCGANAADPLVAGDKVFISSSYGVGCVLLSVGRSRVRPVWRNTNMRNQFSSTVLWKQALYGFDETTLRCLDFRTGEVMWSQPGFGKGTLMVADGKLIILSERGELTVARARPTRYEELARAQVLKGRCWTVPVLANGRIYCRSHEGNVVCVDVSGDARTSNKRIDNVAKR